MANTKSAKKAIKVSERNRKRNVHFKSKLKTTIKKFLELLESKDASASTAIRLVIKTIDQTAAKKIINKSKASRMKSNLMKKLNVFVATESNANSNSSKAESVSKTTKVKASKSKASSTPKKTTPKKTVKKTSKKESTNS
jgi:small subunit ribosomal protein S20